MMPSRGLINVLLWLIERILTVVIGPPSPPWTIEAMSENSNYQWYSFGGWLHVLHQVHRSIFGDDKFLQQGTIML